MVGFPKPPRRRFCIGLSSRSHHGPRPLQTLPALPVPIAHKPTRSVQFTSQQQSQNLRSATVCDSSRTHQGSTTRREDTTVSAGLDLYNGCIRNRDWALPSESLHRRSKQFNPHVNHHQCHQKFCGRRPHSYRASLISYSLDSQDVGRSFGHG